MKLFYFTLLFIIPFATFSQTKGTTFGFQFKPIIPIDYFNAGAQNLEDSVITVNLSPKFGTNAGVLIRQSIGDKFAIETGISQTKRNYQIKAKSKVSSTTDNSDFGFVSYQIPVQGLFYIQLSQNIYMNTTAGIGIDMYPSNIFTVGENVYLSNLTLRRKWLNFSLLANLGLEYRTEEKGTFYFGASLNNPFKNIAVSKFNYTYTTAKTTQVSTLLNGNYLSLDFRFFFPD